MKNPALPGRRRLRAALVAAVMGGTVLAGTGLAHAEGNPTLDMNSNDELSLMSSERCAGQSEEYRFRFYYSPGYQGAWVNVGHNIYDLLALKMPYSPAYPLRFCDGTGSGSGQNVGNNAASAFNWYEGYIGTVYYSAGYKGASDTVAARYGVSTLQNTRNDNRSIHFMRTW